MAIFKIFPEKDTTLYSAYPTQNTGLDEILDISSTYMPDDPHIRRAIIKFSSSEIANVINNKISGSVTNNSGELLPLSKDYKAYLKGFFAEIDSLNSNTIIETYPVYDSWDMGIGKFSDEPKTTVGCSWTYNISPTGRWETSSFPAGVTASFLPNNPGGGSWYTASINNLEVKNTQSLKYIDNKDLNVNVTSVIKLINSNSINNEGFIIKQSKENEFIASQAKSSNLKYFSSDTHTIYPPHLEFRWRDYIFNTGSSTNTIINTPQLVCTLDNNGSNFTLDSIHKFYVNCRPKFPARVFKTSSLYTTNYYLPTSSYYAIKDLHTNEFIIDFDTNYTQISADEKGSYFKIYMGGLQPERYYKFLLKTEIGGSTLILDDNYYFKIVNG